MKICKDCNIKKDKSLFYGVQNECKECTKKRVKANSLKVGGAYDFSEKGVFRVIYKTQKANQRNRGFGSLPYTKIELVSWCKENGFDSLFSEWVKSGNNKDLKPSVDRIDDLKGYSFSNISMGTWIQNREHQYSDIRNGIGTGGRRCKKVLKRDGGGVLVSEYVSYNSAVRDIGYSIEYQIKKGVQCRSGFYWSYAKCNQKKPGF